MSKRDYYKVLDVPRTATEADIKKAYRRLAMKYHPDRNPGDHAAEEKFKEAAEAYAILADSEKRSLYDRFGHAGVKSAAGAGLETTRVTCAVWTVEPLVPVMVSGYEPGATLEVVVTASVDAPPPVTVEGVNDPLAPVGRPDTVSATLPLKPPVGVTFVV